MHFHSMLQLSTQSQTSGEGGSVQGRHLLVHKKKQLLVDFSEDPSSKHSTRIFKIKIMIWIGELSTRHNIARWQAAELVATSHVHSTRVDVEQR